MFCLEDQIDGEVCFKQTKDSETQGEGGLRIVWSEEAAEHPRRSPGGRWGYCYTELLGEA